MARKIFLILILQAAVWNAYGQNDEVPRDLAKRFDRYTQAWKHRDWNLVFDLTAPLFQELLLRDSGSETRAEWVKHQEEDFKDKIESMEVTAGYRLSDAIFTFRIVTKGKHPDGNLFSSEGYSSFELFDGQWYLVNPAPPRRETDGRKKEKGREQEKKP